MASDLSSGCTDDIEIFDEKEEGEISLEDVSSSEEIQSNYRTGFRLGGRCPNCMSRQRCPSWCSAERDLYRKSHHKQDAVHGKENRRRAKDVSIGTAKQQQQQQQQQHAASTLQEKNDDDDLVPISSDSDMEIVGLPGNSKNLSSRVKSSKVRKKRKKKRNHSVEDAASKMDVYAPSIVDATTKNRSSRSSHRRESLSPRYNVQTRPEKAVKSPSRRSRIRSAKSPSSRSRSPLVSVESSKKRNSPGRFVSRENRDEPVHVDVYATKLLKRVRRLESVGAPSPKDREDRKKEHSSLREKLRNMMGDSSVREKDARNSTETREKSSLNNNVQDGASDEEDIELLRRLALETKKKNETNEGARNEEKVEDDTSDDNDSEALKLRMIALHSAVMKKHKNRVERGVASKNRSRNKTRSDSPLGASSSDDAPPNEEISDSSVELTSEKSTSHPDPGNPADMELDTDVEREKEKDSMPYSPTDDLTSREIVETLPNAENAQPEAPATLSNVLNSYQAGVDTPFSPSTETPPKVDDDSKKNSEFHETLCNSPSSSIESLTNYLENPDSPYSPSKPVDDSKITDDSPKKTMVNPEVPYSPTDTPIYYPELTHFSPSPNDVGAGSASKEDAKICEVPDVTGAASLPTVDNGKSSDIDNATNPTTNPDGSASREPDVAKNYAVEALPEVDLDGSPLVPLSKESCDNIDLINDISTIPPEPFYLQGLPEVTRDNNKIPTLVNRTLVPATILKSNKNLQQPLPIKKIDATNEPSFKSADMIPVDKIVTRTTTTFKPLKLCPITKKSITPARAEVFDSSFGEEATEIDEMIAKNTETCRDPETTPKNNEKIPKLRKSLRKTANSPERKKSSPGTAKSAKNSSLKRRKSLTNRGGKLSETGSSERKKMRKKMEEKKIRRSSVKEPPMVAPCSGETRRKSRDASEGEIARENSKTEETKDGVSGSAKETKAEEVNERKRRCSLDEDEEELRALLLASLPKRSKPAEIQKTTPPPPSLSETRNDDSGVGNSSTKSSNDSTRSIEISNTPRESLISNKSPITQSPIEKSVEIPGNVENICPSVTNTSPRKRVAIVTKTTPKKITKRALPVLASTKVVNNAKKYQNTMLQKKMNLRRAVSLYSAANGSRNITLNNLKINDVARPSSPKIKNVSKIQRLVINLESDTDSEAEVSTGPSNARCAGDANFENNRKPLAIPTTDFEESVVQFLKDQRKKLESVGGAKCLTNSTTTTTNTVTTMTMTTATTMATPTTTIASKSPVAGSSIAKISGTYNTPLAVRRHLPVSQQEEYRRLKQQIMERERQMLQKTGSDSSLVQSGKPSFTPPGPLSPANSMTAGSSPKSMIARSPGAISAAPSREKCPEQNGIDHSRPITSRLTKKIVSPMTNKIFVNTGTIASKISANVTSVTISKPPGSSTPKGTKEKTDGPSILKNVATGNALPKVSITGSQTIATNVIRSAKTSIPASQESRKIDPNVVQSSTNNCQTSVSSKIASGSTETLTIRIPNDKVATDATRSSMKNDSKNSPTLRILTKEQLNNRFGNIQVERGPEGRKVTVGTPNVKNADLPRGSAVNAPETKKIDETIDCDNSLNGNDNDGDIQGEYNPVNDASTLIVSQDNIEDVSAASTILNDDNSHNRETNARNSSTNLSRTKSDTIQVKEIWDGIRNGVKAELEILVKLPKDEQEKLLMENQENLVAKRNSVLDDLTEMSGCLRQWEVEREIQTKMIAEVRRLREELRIAENRLQNQRRQMNEMGPRVTRTHEKINQGRRECYKLSRICQGLGARIVGQDYKVPNTGARLLNERLKEVAVHTRQLSKKKVSTSNNGGILNATEDITSSPDTSVQIIEERCQSPLRESGGEGAEELASEMERENVAPSPIIESNLPSDDTRVDDEVPSSNDPPDKIDALDVTIEKSCDIEVDPGTEKNNEEVVPATTTEKEKCDEISANTNSTMVEKISIDRESNEDQTGDPSIIDTPTFESPPFRLLTDQRETQTTKKLDDYNSVLTHFKVPRNVNPDGILCPYELMGTCNDVDCQFYHLDPDRLAAKKT